LLVEELQAVVGPSHLLLDPDLMAPYETDWTGRFIGTASAVVRPAGTADVAAIAKACSAHGRPMTVQGGNTGLVGGATPPAGPEAGVVLISLTRLTTREPVDPIEGQVTVGAGVTLEALQRHAQAAGLHFGVDLAARASATVGGLVATNAGGLNVLRYGSMRQQVTGVEAVLADGTVISRLSGLAKDNTGYDLPQLLVGSEGTLAIITRVRVRLVPPEPARAVALVALAGTEAALELVAAARSLPGLTAAELFYPAGLDLVREYARLSAPFAAPTESPGAYLLLECAGPHDPTDDLLALLEGSDVVEDATLAADPAGRAKLWAYREQHTEAVSAAGVPVKLDVSVPLRALPDLVGRLDATVAEVAPKARVIVFGHVNEGNLHVNVLEADDVVVEPVLRLVAGLGGSISSEHGIGRAKAAWLALSRSAEEIATMRRIKAALDPQHLLNPGVLFSGR
jgi:FAD/FMN-containing dehydrogenase